MKLTYFQLEAYLQKNLPTIILISGDEVLLKQEAINWVKKAAKQAGFNERIRPTSNNDFTWEQLFTLFNSNSMLSEKRIIELDCTTHLPNKMGGQILQEYAIHNTPDTLLLMDLPKIDAKIAKSTWYQALEKAGIVVNIWPISRDQLPKWIAARAKKYKLTITNDAINVLADFVEGNIIAAANTLEKIYLLRNTSPINIEIMTSIINDESSYTIYDFIDHLLTGDMSRTLHTLMRLREDNVEPILILWAITRELRSLVDLCQEIKNGVSIPALLQKQRLFPRRQIAMQAFLKRSSLEECWQLLKSTARIDQIIKGAINGNVWDELELFCLRLA